MRDECDGRCIVSSDVLAVQVEKLKKWQKQRKCSMGNAERGARSGGAFGKKEESGKKEKMSQGGIEPPSTACRAVILTTILLRLRCYANESHAGKYYCSFARDALRR